MTKRFIKGGMVVGLVLALGAPAVAQVNQNGGVLNNDTTQIGQQQNATGGSVGPAAGIGSSAVVGSGNSASTSSASAGVNSTIRNDNRDTNVNSNTSRNRNTNIQGQGQQQQIRDSANSNISIDASTGDTPYQAPAVFAPNLAVAPETCMGSISTGGSAAFSGAGFGLTFGTTWKSHDCELRMFARSLAQLGPQYATAAVALLAQNADVKKALQDAGIPVPGAKAEVPVASVPAAVKQEKRDVSEMKDNRPAVQAVSALQAQMEQIQGM